MIRHALARSARPILAHRWTQVMTLGPFEDPG